MPIKPLISLVFWLLSLGTVQADLLTYPYIQDLSTDKAVLCWVSHDADPVSVRWLGNEALSLVTPTSALNFNPAELEEFPDLSSQPRFLHTVTLDKIEGRDKIEYQVQFPNEPYNNAFRGLPSAQERVRIIAYGDSETEPESTGKPAKWATPEDPKRLYLVDQTTGYQANLEAIGKRAPSAVLIAGDLVESGGEQRDWDEFWRHKKTIAGAIPFLTAPGNHEYYAGPRQGKYETESSRAAIAKYRTYFPKPYYAKELGRVTVISLDSIDSLPHRSEADSNHYLQAAGDFAPGYFSESEQVKWLEDELARAQKKGQFIAVIFHHCPYSSGVHGLPPGSGDAQDPQSGQPLQALTPLFLKYGVDVLLNGHDEMMERSEVVGQEITPDGESRPTTLQVYDVGIGGDGLRGPEQENPLRKFLAYSDSPEVWENGVLRSGGRHYGHLEIDVTPTETGWTATLTPVYILPLPDGDGWKFERREYPDRLTLP
ncbi:MAG: metallophosphoesterase [Candidatus Eremiobacteraeota bacterium]|nr:metallophosphoesterase [Candidatus Eremiobacteraeota bacterium]